jgi:ADP-ribose pyrophosphatase
MNRIVEEIYRGSVISLALEDHRLPDGRRARFEIVRHSGGAAVLPLLPGGRVVLIRQFRPAAGGMVLEVPAGRLEGEESPESCIGRELQEETGYSAGKLEKLGEMLTTPGYSDEVVHLFAASELTAVERSPEPDEFIEMVILPLAEALEMVCNGEISDGRTQLALLLYAKRAGEPGAGSP